MVRLELILTVACLNGAAVAFSPLDSRSSGLPSPPQSSISSREQASVTTSVTKERPDVSRRSRPSNDGTGKFDVDDWKWCYSSNSDLAESSYPCNDIEGSVPPDLVGTLYRNGPGNFERGNRRYEHTLDGDGFVASWVFHKDGSVDYRGRFVETEYYLKEEEKDEILFRNTFGTQREGGMLANALDVKLKNVANTNVVSFRGRLFALWEAGKPYELDPTTLQTLPDSNGAPFDALGRSDSMRGVTIDNGGLVDQALNLGRAFTAHPHAIDDDSLAVFSWAQEPISKTMCLQFTEYDSDWNVKYKLSYDMPNCVMASHDFAYSEDYYAFFENSMTFDMSQFLSGAKGPAQVLMQNLDNPCKLHFVPRRSKEAFQVDVPHFFCIHNSAAMIENKQENTLTILSSGWDLSDERYYPRDVKEVPFLGSWGGEFPNFDVIPPSTLFQTTVDLTTKQLVKHSTVMSGLNFEHPHSDSRAPAVIYGPCSNVVGLSTAPSGYCRVDTERDSMKVWWTEDRIFSEEVVVVPKRDPQRRELHDGCWLLGVLHDAEANRSSLAIVDGDDIEGGPVCRIHLKHSLAYSLHGSFSPAVITLDG